MLAEVVGPDGRVVSVDIDTEVVERARALLEATGYGGRVTVVQADAEHGLPGTGPFDAIIVTVGAWDIPPAWREQLAADGRLVVPLRMNGVTRTIGFRREGDHLVSTSSEVAGFVPMQGDGEHADEVVTLTDAAGQDLKLRFDHAVPEDPSLLEGVLMTRRVEVWSGVMIENGVSFADLYLWFASFLLGFCRLAADEGADLARERKRWFPFGAVHGDSLAYLAVRPAMEGAGVEFGARGHGPHAEDAAAAVVEQVQAWDRQARGGPAPTFRVLAGRQRSFPAPRGCGGAAENPRCGHDRLARHGLSRSGAGCTTIQPVLPLVRRVMSMPPTLTLDGALVDGSEVVADEEFELDMRVVEAETPLVIMMCDTSNGCGSTCATSACSTASNDPA